MGQVRGHDETTNEITLGEYRRLKAVAESEILESIRRFAGLTGANIDRVNARTNSNWCGASIVTGIEIEAWI